jgi:putative ABC transport system permease protein
MGLVVAGVGIGLAGSLALARVMSDILFEINPNDPVTFGSIVVVLIGVAFVATYLPARRATRLDPMSALRCD